MTHTWHVLDILGQELRVLLTDDNEKNGWAVRADLRKCAAAHSQSAVKDVHFKVVTNLCKAPVEAMYSSAGDLGSLDKSLSIVSSTMLFHRSAWETYLLLLVGDDASSLLSTIDEMCSEIPSSETPTEATAHAVLKREVDKLRRQVTGIESDLRNLSRRVTYLVEQREEVSTLIRLSPNGARC